MLTDPSNNTQVTLYYTRTFTAYVWLNKDSPYPKWGRSPGARSAVRSSIAAQSGGRQERQWKRQCAQVRCDPFKKPLSWRRGS